jgi:energy-coupling factor transport system substrate-specific component
VIARAPSPYRLHLRANLALLLASLFGFVAFFWPFLIQADGTENLAHSSDAPWVFALLLPLLLAIVVTEVADGSMDSKAVALLGVLAACGTALRLPGGVTGFEPVFFLLIPAGRVFGKGFGFVLGALTLFASALITGGVGPWLPFQMLGAAWVGYFAGCLPRGTGRREIVLLAVYGFVAGLAYGFLLNLWFWPFGSDAGSQVAFEFGAPLFENLRRYWAFYLATSLGWDLPRAITNAVLVLVAGRPVLAALRRVARRAAFGRAGEFVAVAEPNESVEAQIDSVEASTAG